MAVGTYEEYKKRIHKHNGVSGCAIDYYSYMFLDANNDIVTTYDNKIAYILRPDDTALLRLPDGGWGQWATWVRHIGNKFDIQEAQKHKTIGLGACTQFTIITGPAAPVTNARGFTQMVSPTTTRFYAETEILCTPKPGSSRAWCGEWEMAQPGHIVNRTTDRARIKELTTRLTRDWNIHMGSFKLTGDNKQLHHWPPGSDFVHDKKLLAAALANGLTYDQFKAVHSRHRTLKRAMDSVRIELYEYASCYL